MRSRCVAEGFGVLQWPSQQVQSRVVVRPKLQAVLDGFSVFTDDILAAGRRVEAAVDVGAVHPLYLQACMRCYIHCP